MIKMFLIYPGTQKIYLDKGDTASMHVSIYDADGKQYQPEEDEIIRLEVRRNEIQQEPTFSVDAENETLIIDGQCTANLLRGCYVYELKLIGDDNTFTIIPTNGFIIG